MSIKMIVTDMDGTLLDNTRGEIVLPASAAAAIKKAAARGIAVVLASGRMYRSLLPYAEKLQLDAPIISYNGALVKSEREGAIYSCPLAPAVVRELIAYAAGRNLYIQSYAGDELYFSAASEHSRVYQRASGISGRAVGYDGLAELKGDVPKLLAVVDEEPEADIIIAEINRRYAGRVHAMRSAARYIELINPAVSKGAAVASLAARYGLTKDEVMCLGDAENDISMIEFAGVGVAMGNAAEGVRAAADFVTKSVHDDGFAYAVEKFAL